jgi:membrane-bound lytic murein transglycosylase
MITIGSNYAAQSQTIDTLCPPVAQLKKVYAAAAQKKVLDSLVISLNADIRSYEIVVKQLQEKDSVNVEIIRTYIAMIDTMKEQRKILEDQIATLNKEVKKWKRKTRWTAIAGAVATIGGIVTTVFLIK